MRKPASYIRIRPNMPVRRGDQHPGHTTTIPGLARAAGPVPLPSPWRACPASPRAVPGCRAPGHARVLRLVGLAEAGDGQGEKCRGEGASDADACGG